MTTFERILFPVDFSEASEAMVGDVVEMARRFHASVTALHAFNEVQDHNLAPDVDAPFGPEPGGVPYTPELKELREARNERLKEFVREHLLPAGVEAKAVVEDGDPAHAIEWTAKQEQSELVMMSMEGKGTLRRVLKGSLPAKVLHTLQCPVYISPHKRGELPSSPDGFQTILCAVPPEPESEAALGIAAAIAAGFGSRVCLLQTGSAEKAPQAEQAVLGIRSALQKARGEAVNLAVEVRTVDAELPEAVRQTAMEEDANLVIVGRGLVQSAVSHIWSNLYTVLDESPCPVLTV
jgi:nucleotide-binding universal stress UspA family protein